MEYDKNNNSSFQCQYMRLRVKVDVRLLLKQQTKVKNKGGYWCTVNFKYEILSLFFFVCGILGHLEQKCEIHFAMKEDNGVRVWNNEIRADTRRYNRGPSSRWLKHEGSDGGSSGTGNNNINSDPKHVAQAAGTTSVEHIQLCGNTQSLVVHESGIGVNKNNSQLFYVMGNNILSLNSSSHNNHIQKTKSWILIPPLNPRQPNYYQMISMAHLKLTCLLISLSGSRIRSL